MVETGRAVARPSGTVTFLFTDIEGSTKTWEQHPELMRVALARHDVILRAAVDSFTGYVFSTGGDGFAVAFHRAADGVAAAVAAQRALAAEPWPEPLTLTVRMGLHTGECDERDGDYFGPPVNRTARLMAAAWGGQIVVSDVTAGLAGHVAGRQFVDLGLHRLKGVAEDVRVFAVEADGLARSDRALVTYQQVPGNLPHPMTEFVGRLDALRRRAALLPDRRLVTLTGPGGVGKTRMAVETGWLCLEAFPGGVWMVELAALADSDVAIASVAAVLSVRPQPGMSTISSVVDWLRGRRMLLILDNCEHVLAPMVELVSAIVAGCETVTVLATSREPLGLVGERVIPLESLATRDGVELFRDRAAMADESLVFSEQDGDLIARVCERLDGIPLAIELAAARMRSMTLVDLATRLHDRFRLLRGSGRSGLERHRTLWAAVEWSYQLLSTPEQVLFDRLSVFADGFDLDAAEQVCIDELLDCSDILELLSSLVDKSMVIADRSKRTARFRQLETLRQFGEDRLGGRGDTARIRDRHVLHYVAVTRRARELEMSSAQLEGEATLDHEWSNVRDAVAWAMASNNLDAADDLLFHTASHAFQRVHQEYGEWIDRLLATETDVRARPSRIYESAAAMASLVGDHNAAVELCRRGIEQNSDAASVADCWLTLSVNLVSLGRLEEGREALAIAEAEVVHTDDPYVNYWVLHGLAAFAWFSDLDSMPVAVARLSTFAERVGAPFMLSGAAWLRALLYMADGDFDRAIAEANEARSIAIATKSVFDEGASTVVIVSALLMGNSETIPSECSALVARLHDVRYWPGFWGCAASISRYLVHNQRTMAGATLAGYLDANVQGGVWLVREFQDTLDKLRTDPRAREWMSAGAHMDRDRAVAYVFDHLHS